MFTPEYPVSGVETQAPLPLWEQRVFTIAKNYPEHLEVAGIVFYADLLKLLHHPNPDVQQFLQSEGIDATTTSGNFTTSHYAGLIEHFRNNVSQQEQEFPLINSQSPRSIEGNESLAATLRAYDPYIQSLRDKTLEKAASWSPQQAKQALNKAALSMQMGMSKEQKQQLFEITGYKVPGTAKALFQYGISGAYNYASFSALEAFAVFAGGIAETANPLKDADPRIANACIVISYIPWMIAAYKNSEEMYNLLEKNGICSSVTAKLFYDIAKKKTDNPKYVKAATFAGSMVWQAAMEVPYYIGALAAEKGLKAIDKDFDADNAWKSGIIGANLGAAGFNVLQAMATHEIAKGKPLLQKFTSTLHHGKKSNEAV